MSVVFNPTCPTDCSGSVPDVSFNECSPEVNAGEITHVFLAEADASDFTDVEDLVEWTARLDGITGDIKQLTVIGDMPEAEVNEIQISDDRTAISNKSFTINFEIDETNDVNYQFLRTLECNTKMKMWFQTAAGKMYGGLEGILATVRGNLVIPRERNDIERFMLKATWRSKFSPSRSTSPLV
jgi:hypothetical protein